MCRDVTKDPDLQMPGTCYGCDKVPFSGKQVDRCGECDGDGRYSKPYAPYKLHFTCKPPMRVRAMYVVHSARCGRTTF